MNSSYLLVLQEALVLEVKCVYLSSRANGTRYSGLYIFKGTNTNRRPEVTCLTIHPSGHFFAIGHADGSIAFWAVDDDSNPLSVRTLDEEDVHLADGGRDEADPSRAGQGAGTTVLREPIFKLAWSSFSASTDPRGGPTTLTILGGLDSRRGGYITVLLLPAFQPANPPADSGGGEQGVLQPFFRTAMRESLTPLNASTYEVDGEVQDFLLCPREHLHLGGNHNPYAIMCLQSTYDGRRVTLAYRFPPPCWGAPLGQPACEEKAAGDDELIPIELPFPFIHGSASVEGIHLMTVGKDVYEAFVDADSSVPSQRLELTGGVACAEQTSGEIRSTKVVYRVTLHLAMPSEGFPVSTSPYLGDARQPWPLPIL